MKQSISYKEVHSCCRRETFQADLKATGQSTFKPVVSSSWLRGYETPQVSQSPLQLWAAHKALFQGVKQTALIRYPQTLTLMLQKTAGCPTGRGALLPKAPPNTAKGSSLLRFTTEIILLLVLTTDTEISHLILKLRHFN